MTMQLGELAKINQDIAIRENDGAADYFRTLLAPHFAMRRANGTTTDREGFIASLKRGGERQTLRIDSLALLGEQRALCACTIGTPDGTFDNLRVFVRDAGAPEGWLLLAWVNEPATGTRRNPG
jgi:hypothetical protein